MEIVEFFLIIWRKGSELEPEPEFLTSWSRSWSRMNMDRLRNTACSSTGIGTVKLKMDPSYHYGLNFFYFSFFLNALADYRYRISMI
jgi:hypothetical protein